MSRILLIWELGHNLGHLTRLLPLARRLQDRGHQVSVAVRDIEAAVGIAVGEKIDFIQAPLHVGVPASATHGAGYADLLLAQGWDDRSALWGIVQCWITLYRLFRPDVVVLDYSPGARLAGHITDVPCVLIGSGFELPPTTVPMPAFPDLPGSLSARASQSEQLLLGNINAVLDHLRVRRLDAARQLVTGDATLLLTFPELDHYWPRAGQQYIGPLSDPDYGEPVEWPNDAGRRIFAYLRPQTPHLAAILEGLMRFPATVICYAPGVAPETLGRLHRPGLIFVPAAVQIVHLLGNADVCVSYAPSGTTTSALLRGVPQLLAPPHIEAQLTATRVERLGAGLILRGIQTTDTVMYAIQKLIDDSAFKINAKAFAEKHCDFDPVRAADHVVATIETVASCPIANSSPLPRVE